MYGLTDFYIATALAEAIARKQDAAEARKLEQPARPSLLARLRGRLVASTVTLQTVHSLQQENHELGAVQCE